MRRTGIANTLPVLILAVWLHSPDVASAFQSETGDAGIHNLFRERLNAAARGNPVDTRAIEQEIASAVERQIELFVEQTGMTADEQTMAVARNAEESMELADCLVTMLSGELRNESISDMECRYIRETLESLDVRVGWDYSITVGAIPPEKVSVRICLPKLHPCGGCKKALESALESTGEFEDAMVDLQTRTAQFLAASDRDVEGKLDELEQAGVQQLAEWKLVRK